MNRSHGFWSLGKNLFSPVRMSALFGLLLILVTGVQPDRVQANSHLHDQQMEIQGNQILLIPEPQPTPAWIPSEDETAIASRQHPLKFPLPEVLPDLRTLPPFGFVLETEPGTRQRTLRFSNSIWNSGTGTLEVNGIQFEGRNRVRVQQHVYRSDGTYQARDAGIFHFDSEHGHWHWENFSVYELWSVTTTGQLGEQLFSSDKIGYCLIDVARELGPRTPDGEPVLLIDPPDFRQYTQCDAALQGLSSGWTDTYRNHLPGQSMDISTLPEGLYALRSTVDPENRIRELDEENNSALIYFVLRADRVVLLDGPVKTPRQWYAWD